MSLTDEIVRADGQRLIRDVPTLDLGGATLTLDTLRDIATLLETHGRVCVENCKTQARPGEAFSMLGKVYVLATR